MGKFIDLVGQKFNHLTVLKRAENIGRYTAWLCECDCPDATKIIVRGANLKNNHTKSCGCQRIAANIKRNNEARAKDSIIGKTFGKLTVIKESEKRTKNRKVLYECCCSCGSSKVVCTTKDQLIRKHTTSCGCILSKGEEKIKQLLINNSIPFEMEKTFPNCILPSGRKARFDFYVNNSYIIEFDGKQHFQAEKNGWNTEEHFQNTQKHDKIKNQYCFYNNIPLIRIPYTHLEDITINDLKLSTSKFIVCNERRIL